MIKLIEHIVRMNESVDSILNTYQISIDELRNNNSHITDFNNLRCGMKLLIPYFSKNVEQVLESTESFVQKYYPKISEVVDEKKESIDEVLVEDEIKDIKVEMVDPPKVVKEDANVRKYVGIIPPKKPYKGNIKI